MNKNFLKRAKFACMLFTVFAGYQGFSQGSIRDSAIAMHIVGIGYSFQVPGGDLADRFGNSSMVGLNYAYKLKSNFIFSLNGGYIFGGDLKEDAILTGIASEDGSILGNDGRFADIRLYERGHHISLTFGKVFRFKKPNPNSGIVLMAGPGFLQHKIRIETIGNTVPQLNKEYKKGYDRLTNGMEINESIAYYYFGNRYLVNFYFGFEFIQAFTQNRRNYNFDTMMQDDKKRVDLLFGIKAGWMLPIYRKAPNKYYFN
ncbi:MAG TPA: hypothetical protein VJY62_01900 [Bacteroidia bacterium]|nr:hypothetical protein [Bacteroidia bacterium]